MTSDRKYRENLRGLINSLVPRLHNYHVTTFVTINPLTFKKYSQIWKRILNNRGHSIRIEKKYIVDVFLYLYIY
ncbi:MAG: hypothetical protein DRP96_08205 [Candidatus Neomarinimicrobiota bacterium]|nr:MAG: hypothetical protein DRP96_08205 [Candidatus Neomarinimicrobiota bacterium]